MMFMSLTQLVASNTSILNPFQVPLDVMFARWLDGDSDVNGDLPEEDEDNVVLD